MLPAFVPFIGGVSVPRIVATATTDGTASQMTSFTVNLPAGIRAGELLVVVCYAGATGLTARTFSATGYTAVYSSGNSGNSMGILYKTATGSEGATVTVTASGLSTIVAISCRVSPTNTAVNPAAGGATGTSSTPDPPSLTPGFASLPVLWIAVAGSQAASITGYPANYTMNQTTIAGASVTFSLALASRQIQVATENPGSFTSATSATWNAATMAVSP